MTTSYSHQSRRLFWLWIIACIGCAGKPEWRRRADKLESDFPRPAARGQRCLDDVVLANGLRAAVNSAAFSAVWDYGPLYGEGCPAAAEKSPACAPLIGQVGTQRFPQIDLSVVAFNPPACAQKVAKATVVFDRSHPRGFVATYDAATLAINNIRFRKWDEARFNGGRFVSLDGDAAPEARREATIEAGSETAWDAPFPDDSWLGSDRARRAPGSIDFMSPWPASSFKLMVATRILKLIDSGQSADGQPIDLQTPISLPTQDLVSACLAEPRTLTLKQTLETMLQWSGNCATAGLLRFLHAHHEIVQSPIVNARGYPLEPPVQSNLNATLRDLGLSTLQMNRTIEQSGRWGNPNNNYDGKTASVANNHMTSWDAARLMWLFESDTLRDDQRPRWTISATNKSVNSDFISAKTKAILRDLLRDSYSGSVLANNRTCAPESATEQDFGILPEPGIPALLSAKWIDGNKVRHPFADHPYANVVDDVGPSGDESIAHANLSACQRRAEVEYLNKPGLTNVAASSVGIVRGLDRGFGHGRFRRHYIVSFFSSLGTRYADAARMKAAGLDRDAKRASGISTTQAIPRLGAKLDAWLALWLEEK